ncbi:MAG: DUF4097 domain-containing protein [Bdellovibrionales bacterium]
MRFNRHLIEMGLFYYWIFLIASSFADKVGYPPQAISAEGIQRIQISGVKGMVRFRGRSSRAYHLKVRHSRARTSEDWHLSVQRRDSVLIVEVFNVAYGSQWKRYVREELWPDFDVELEGPAVPVTLSWREGTVSVRDWKGNVELSLLKGLIEFHSVKGRYRVQGVSTDVHVRGLNGELALKGGRGNVRLARVSGVVKLNLLGGEIRAEGVRGQVRVESLQGRIHVRRGSGEWAIKTPRGRVQIEEMTGRLEGKGNSAQWDVQAGRKLDVHLTSGSGPVRVRITPQTARIFLSSRSGSIDVPKGFRSEDRDGVRVVEMAPGLSRRIFVQTESGAIRLRQ